MAREELANLLRSTDPASTSLLLGAGAAYSSGAPLAADLCRHLESELAGGETISDDLAELAGILEHRNTRQALIESIARRLASLEPDGGLMALSRHPWRSIFTTNFDCLIEKAYQRTGSALSVVRSHFEWEAVHDPAATRFFKIHGCITQDRALGHRASMIITAEDYSQFASYRRLLFDRLKMDLAGSSCWIVGYSLRDPHVKALVDDALRLQRESGAPGRIFLLVHEYDEDRAALWRSRGVRGVAQGDLNAFAHEMASIHDPGAGRPIADAEVPELPLGLAACTIDAARATHPSNPRRLFFGGAASFGDVRAGLTFERDAERTLLPPSRMATVITGVAGTGKTTLARRMLIELAVSKSWLAFEHRPEFPLQTDLWIDFERTLSGTGHRAVLLIDNCPAFQRQLNALIRRLPPDGALHVVATAETSTWKPRQKDSRLFSHATSAQLSRLSSGEIRQLRTLVTSNEALRALLSPEFARQSRTSQEETLRQRCSADMFVCLKALFSSETLDDIVLREYAAIDPAFQAIYRTTAALEAAGALPHRQMILRVTGVTSSLIPGALDVLEGLVDEQDVVSSPGIYIWRTRHEVIASLVSRYKYSDAGEFKALLEATISSANPTYYEEVRTLREMCNADRGIRALPDPSDRIGLYRRVIEVLPGDRVARHRLVRELIEDERFGDAEAELRSAIEDVGLDPPLQRYRIRLHILRSRGEGLMDEDRRSILRTAMTEAEHGIRRFGDSKYMYFAAADVAEEWFSLTKERGQLEWAKHLLANAYETLLDPDIRDRAARLGRR